MTTISDEFGEWLVESRAPLPWNLLEPDSSVIIDRDEREVCRAGSTEIAAAIVVAVNTCGGFAAAEEDEE